RIRNFTALYMVCGDLLIRAAQKIIINHIFRKLLSALGRIKDRISKGHIHLIILPVTAYDIPGMSSLALDTAHHVDGFDPKLSQQVLGSSGISRADRTFPHKGAVNILIVRG